MPTSTPFIHSRTVDVLMCRCAVCSAVHSVRVHPLFSCFCSALVQILVRKALVPGTKCSAIHVRSNEYCFHHTPGACCRVPWGGVVDQRPGVCTFLEKNQAPNKTSSRNIFIYFRASRSITICLCKGFVHHNASAA